MRASLQYRNLATLEECLQSEDLQKAGWGEDERDVISWRLMLDKLGNHARVYFIYLVN